MELVADDTTVIDALAEVCRRIDDKADAYIKPAKYVTSGRSRPSLVVPPSLLPRALEAARRLVAAWALEAEEPLRGVVHLTKSFSREANMLRRALMTRGDRAVFTCCEIETNGTESNGAIIAERLKLLTLQGAPEASLDVPEGAIPLASHLQCVGGSVVASEADVRLAEGSGPLKLRAISTTSSVVSSNSCLFQRVANPSFFEVLRISGVGHSGLEALRARGLVALEEPGLLTLVPEVDYARVEEILNASGEKEYRAERPEEFFIRFESLGCCGASEVLESVKAAVLAELADLEAQAREGANADAGLP